MIQRTYGGVLGPMNSFNIADIKNDESVASSYKASHIAVKVPILEADIDKMQYMTR